MNFMVVLLSGHFTRTVVRKRLDGVAAIGGRNDLNKRMRSALEDARHSTPGFHATAGAALGILEIRVRASRRESYESAGNIRRGNGSRRKLLSHARSAAAYLQPPPQKPSSDKGASKGDARTRYDNTHSIPRLESTPKTNIHDLEMDYEKRHCNDRVEP
jgi:hypothetical protein